MSEYISLNHGSGGSLAGKLIRNIFVKRFGMDEPLTDSAVLKENGLLLAFTTDSYVVDPIFFPGGDIGKLAVCGTVNDLSVSGAMPKYISASFIIDSAIRSFMLAPGLALSNLTHTEYLGSKSLLILT